MISFLFGWMGAAGFWFLYGTLTLFMGTLMLRICNMDTYKFLTGKIHYENDGCEIFECVFVACVFYLFWPFILIWLIFWNILKIAFGMIFGPAMKKVITFVDSLTPHVEIKLKE